MKPRLLASPSGMRHLILFLAILSASCSGSSDVYTLYRASPIDASMRIHVATFDSTEGSEYNRDNCDIARGLFQNQPGVKVRYWCERGPFRGSGG